MNEHDEYLKAPLVVFNPQTGLYDLFTDAGKKFQYADDPRKVISEAIVEVVKDDNRTDTN